MKQKLLILLLIGLQSYAQNVTIPDPNFKEYLLNNPNINLNSDSEIQLTEAQGVIYLDIGNPYGTANSERIGSLEGIQSFVNLITLRCQNNLLTSIDLSQNISLIELDCSFNELSVINITQNINLEKFNCSNNKLTTLDISQNIVLEELIIAYNLLSESIDFSQHVSLTLLNCSVNSLNNLDVTNNILLTELRCNSTGITSLNINQNTALTLLNCNYNLLENLDVSQNLALKYLYFFGTTLNTINVSLNLDLIELGCGQNQLTTIDVSQNTDLVFLWCQDNELVNLDVANGNNINFTSFRANDNSSLNCINVDDVNYSNTNWTGSNYNFDSVSSFNQNCASLSLEDFNNENFIMFPNPIEDFLTIEIQENAHYNLLSITGQILKSGNLNKGINSLNFSFLSNGIYFIQMTTEKRKTFANKVYKK